MLAQKMRTLLPKNLAQPSGGSLCRILHVGYMYSRPVSSTLVTETLGDYTHPPAIDRSEPPSRAPVPSVQPVTSSRHPPAHIHRQHASNRPSKISHERHRQYDMQWWTTTAQHEHRCHQASIRDSRFDGVDGVETRPVIPTSHASTSLPAAREARSQRVRLSDSAPMQRPASR